MSEWNFACPDWVERLKSGQSLVPDLPLFEARAAKAVGIFNRLRLPDVIGQPALADAAGDWFRDIVRAGFGSMDDAGHRHIRKIFTLVPKKNSKTTYSAGVSLTALMMNERPNAEMFYVGPTQAISGKAFRQARGMIKADPEGYLDKRFHIVDNEKKIIDRTNDAWLQVKTFDANIVTGGAPVFTLIDEIHLLSKIAGSADTFTQLLWGMMANPDGLLMAITTQSFEPPAGVFKMELEYARGVRDGLITEDVETLPILYEFPEDMQTDESMPFLDPKYWPLVHPNLGRSITIERLRKSYRESKEKGPDDVRRWCGQNLNIQIGLALRGDRWRGADYWMGAADKTLTLDELLKRCEVIVIGIDGGGADDLLGLCVAGREKGTGRWLYWFHAWVDRKLLEARPEIAEVLRDFAGETRNGFQLSAEDYLKYDLTLVDFETPELEALASYMPPDVVQIVALVKRLDETGLLPEADAVGVDRAGTVMTMLTDELVKIGITNGENETKRRLVAVAQGGWLNAAVEGLPRKLRDGTARHGGQPMMDWCVGNAKAETKGHSVAITKQTSGKAKIDPLMAGFDATMLLAKNPVASTNLCTADHYLTVA